MKQRNIGIILSYTNIFLGIATGMFLSVFLLRRLGAIDYGVYQAVGAFVHCLVLLEFGTGTVMVRNLVACLAGGRDDDAIRRNISTIWIISCFLNAIIFIVSVVFYCSMDYIYAKSMTTPQIDEAKNIFIFMVLYLMMSFAMQTLSGMALAFEDYSFKAKLFIFRNVSRTIFIVAMIFLINKAIVIAVVDACISILLFLYTFFYCKAKFKVHIDFSHFDKEILKMTLPFCFALFLQVLVNQSNSTVGKFIISVMLSPDNVTLYSLGLYIFEMSSAIATIPLSMYMPQIGKDVCAGIEGLDLTKRLIQPSRLIVIIAGTVVFGFVATGRQFMSIMYGAEYIGAWIIAILLLIPMFINMSGVLVINVVDIKNKRHICSMIMVISTLINIVVILMIIKRFGVISVAWATGGSIILMTMLTNWYYSKGIGIKVLYLYWHANKGILCYQIIGALIGYAVGMAIHNTYCSFIASGAVYLLVSFGGFWLRGMNPVERNLSKQMILRIKTIYNKKFNYN